MVTLNSETDTILMKLLEVISEGYTYFQAVYDDNMIINDFIFIDVNSSLEKIMGVEKENIIGKTVRQLIPDIDEDLFEKFKNIADGNMSEAIDNIIKILNRYFKVSAFSLENGGVISIFHDITKAKETEETYNRYQLLFENAGDLILHIAKDGRILAANKKAIEDYGYSLEEIINLNINDLRHPSMRNHLEAQMKNSELTGITFEGVHVRKDGTTFPVEVNSKTTIDGNLMFRIHIIRDITERKKAEEKILHLANYDSLTDIANRGNIMAQLDSSIENAKRGGYDVAFMILDVDKFKTINDTYGHQVGDIILRTTAQRLQSSIRNVDSVGRFGGDEFVIIAPFVKSKLDIEVLISRIFEELNRPVDLGEYAININISVGVSFYKRDSEDIEMLIKQADEAMYLAKNDTGCSYRFF